MKDNENNNHRLVSGGILFALTSIATYQLHKMFRNKNVQPKTPPNSPIECTTPCNSPIDCNTPSNSPIDCNTPSNTPLECTTPCNESQEEECCLVKKEENSESLSFVKLRHTGSQTGTDELNFTKIESNKDHRIYGNPCVNINLTNSRGYNSEINYKSDCESDEIQISYYSESDLLKIDEKRKRNIFQYFRNKKLRK